MTLDAYVLETSMNDPFNDVVLIVDPYSTGCLIAKEISMRGYQIAAVWTAGFSSEMKTHVPQSVGGKMNYLFEIEEVDGDLAKTAELCNEAAKKYQKTVKACLAGGEAGVVLADKLSEFLKLRTNGTEIPNRCDKKMQQDLIRKVGLRSVRQACSDKFEEVESFLKTESYPVVLKPNESAGSDGVKLCHTFEEAKEHFHVLMKSQMVNGGDVPAVLCQEFLKGKEYVVDHVSRDGVHKTMMVWVYDKRPANGAAFVYFGCSPVPSDSPEAKILISYIRGVLDALGIANGPSHGEVIITQDGPCLVEMNCRARGGDGNWRPLAKALNGGYSQVEATADAYLDDYQFAKLPDKPPAPFKSSGDEVCLVSFGKGKVEATPGYDMVKKLPSFVCLETGIKIGTQVDYTVDLLTQVGSVILQHEDPSVLAADIAFIRHMEKINGFFDFEKVAEVLTKPRSEMVAAGGANSHRRVYSSAGPSLIRHQSMDRPDLVKGLVKRVTTIDASKEAVVVVDPYSTGCCVAKEFMNRGYQVIALWTKGLVPEMKLHVPLSVGGPEGLKYFSQITQLDKVEDTIDAVKKAAGMYRVVACFAGGESGVDYADVLSEAMKLRTNGTEIPNRRDKKVQQELIRKAGLRSVRQACGTKFEEVKEFLEREPFPVVLKPVESAGSDGVKLCHTMGEAQDHFNTLMTSQMVNGGDCPAVLCQEFLRGKEYIVDHVSRDGVHKTMMVWCYDKRPANGSAFVYYGILPVEPDSPEARILIPYTRRVLDAIGIKNGPTHGEVIMTSDGPCLVEMNCRANGGDGAWQPLARAMVGYTQVDSAVDSYVDGRQFTITPSTPKAPLKAAGQEVKLVSFSRGKVKATPGFDKIRSLPSFVYMETGVAPGTFVDYTIDLVTCVGGAVLVHEDPEVLAADVKCIRDMEKNNELFTFEHLKVLMQSNSQADFSDYYSTSRADGI